MQQILKKHAKKLRFAVVGGINTALDFGILFLLVLAGLDKIPSNFISTSISFIFSFFANKTFTFQSKNKTTRLQVVLFFGITLFGLWVIQPIIIGLFTPLISPIYGDGVALLLAKLLATVVTLIWNFVLYSRFVFKA